MQCVHVCVVGVCSVYMCMCVVCMCRYYTTATTTSSFHKPFLLTPQVNLHNYRLETPQAHQLSNEVEN